MVMAGFEVESIVDLSQTMRNVVAGKIVKIEKHPDADKLQICQIDVGTGETIQIVTERTTFSKAPWFRSLFTALIFQTEST